MRQRTHDREGGWDVNTRRRGGGSHPNPAICSPARTRIMIDMSFRLGMSISAYTLFSEQRNNLVKIITISFKRYHESSKSSLAY